MYLLCEHLCSFLNGLAAVCAVEYLKGLEPLVPQYTHSVGVEPWREMVCELVEEVVAEDSRVARGEPTEERRRELSVHYNNKMNNSEHIGAHYYYHRKIQDFEALNPFSQTSLSREEQERRERDFSEFLLKIKQR